MNYEMGADGFIFDQEIIAQVVAARFSIAEIPVPVRYFPEASTAGFLDSVVYGLRILYLLGRLESLRTRYSHMQVLHSEKGLK